MTKRVVITGMALASPLGSTIKSAYERLHKYENCIQYSEELEKYENLNTKLLAKVTGFEKPADFDRKVTRTMGPVSVMTVASAREALKEAGLFGDEIITDGRTGVSFGSSSGSFEAIMDFYSMCVEMKLKTLTSGSYIKMMPQTIPVNVSLYFKTHGRLVNTSTACTSGSLGIGAAYELIKNGVQTVMIAGGGEEYHCTQIGIFDTLYATSLKNDKPQFTPAPFDKDRDGLVIGEGTGVLILEEYEHAKSRGVKIYAEIVGFAQNTDGAHITSPNWETMAVVMKQSLQSAGLKPSDIDYVNAHGTGTILGDIAESNATCSVFGNKMPVSSIKSYTGHTLGACGAIEAILSIEMMNNNWFCPTLNLKNIDPKCAELDYIVKEGRKLDTEYIMSNNFAFGGINTSLIFKRTM